MPKVVVEHFELFAFIQHMMVDTILHQELLSASALGSGNHIEVNKSTN